MHQQQPLPDAHNDARFIGIWNAIIVAVDHMRGKYLLNTAHSNRRMSVARPPVQTVERCYGPLRCDGSRFS
ncbi:hypothetical protein GE21DRAFT_1219696 [Neurospora crassa]|nr:hypothetical protein GE21DRAFT_1219696 [Neurospora crassa]